MHTVREQAVSLREIQDVEFDVSEEIIVFNAEEEPLVMASSIGINPHEQVELLVVLSCLNSHVKITTLKIRVKLEHFVAVLNKLDF